MNRLLPGVLAAGVVLAGCANAPSLDSSHTVARGAHYVAMGSSYAAGPGITPTVVDAPARCSRSNGNYAHQLARRRGLLLTDVSCSGATTAHVLGPWNELPAQLDALRVNTKLVTVTIGGNDLGYMGVLFGASCLGLQRAGAGPQMTCSDVVLPTEQDYEGLAVRMRSIAKEVHRRSPDARLVFVDYVTVLPPMGHCDAAPMSDADADQARSVDARLRQITAQVALENGAELLDASAVTHGHDACAPDPWINGFPRPDSPVLVVGFHPRLAGMKAVAHALDRLLAH